MGGASHGILTPSRLIQPHESGPIVQGKKCLEFMKARAPLDVKPTHLVAIPLFL